MTIASLAAGALVKATTPTAPTQKWMMMKMTGIVSVTATVSGAGPIAVYAFPNEFQNSDIIDALRDGAAPGVISLFPLNQATQPGNNKVEVPVWLLGIIDAEGLSGVASFIFEIKKKWVFPEDAALAFGAYNLENAALSASWAALDIRYEISGKWL